MADAILNQVHVTNMFDLRGVVAVVTGGGTVSLPHHEHGVPILTPCCRALDS
jgi:hypothetical protein